ncbi:MucR family transcriptional regulator [Sneathiella marina]|uniref:MucR family transcriptional regulator n=1 Tax=Sneathiella marina TaxID=2950108 RepID=A0ABY4VZP2_9PROT|nr:MucR family transcriptional regulator [Sneathiella marina]USG60091.1 MucR family transcriptional regulator [Sneathiella marina]
MAEMNINTAMDSTGVDKEELLRMTAEITSAYASNNEVGKDGLVEVIKSVYQSLSTLESNATVDRGPLVPAVPIKKSIQNDYLVCLEDGKKLKMLKRYLRSNYEMTPEEYRLKWSLPVDYPMVAPAYAKRRSEFAKEFGLGRKRKTA